MKIKLLSQEIEIVKITDESYQELFVEGECNDNWGMAIYAKNKIVIKNTVQNFRCIMHEIKHFWDDFVGNRQIESFTREQICDSFGAFMNTLILENGIDIIEKLYNFSKDENEVFSG